MPFRQKITCVHLVLPCVSISIYVVNQISVQPTTAIVKDMLIDMMTSFVHHAILPIYCPTAIKNVIINLVVSCIGGHNVIERPNVHNMINWRLAYLSL